MYDVDFIHEIATKFRNGIDAVVKYGEFEFDGWLEYFPRGCCDIVSELLGWYLLTEYDIKSFIAGGKYRDDTHSWIVLEDGIIIDITGDQYKNRRSKIQYNKTVYVGNPDEFHRLFIPHETIEVTSKMWIKGNYRNKEEYYKKIVYYVNED